LQFTKWIKNWEAGYCNEMKTAYSTTKNRDNLSNKEFQITSKYYNLTFGYTSGHPRVYLRKYSIQSDLSETEIQKLLSMLDEAQDRNTKFRNSLRSPKTSEVHSEQPKSSTKPLLKTVEVPEQPGASYTPPLSSAITLGQTAKDKQVIILGGLGQADNKFSNLDAFVKKITDTINKELQGETPYVIRRVKNGAATGVISTHSKSGEEKSITINLIPSIEQKRYYFFTCSAAIYSETTDFNYLLSELRVNAAKKSRLFASETVYYLGFDFINLADFDNLNPQQPDKKYKLLLIYFAGTKPKVITPGQGSGSTPKE
jgi:hypothetical protein